MMLATHLPQSPQLPSLVDDGRESTDTNLSFSLLRSFVRVVDRTSVSLAARDLSLSQPTVSRHITDLERLYGTALLVRSTRSLNITSAGHCLYEAAQAILESERALTDDIGATRGKLGGPLIISAPPNLGDIVASFCSEFLAAHECDNISLRVTNVLPCLVAEGVDVAVRVGKVDDVAANVQRAATFKDVLVAQPALVRRMSVPTHPQDLKNFSWVARAGMDTSAQIRLYRQDRIEHLMVNVRLKTDQLAAHREALLAGAGAGSIEEFAVREDIRAGRLVQLLPEWRLPTWPIQMIYAAKDPRASVRTWATAFVAYLGHTRGMPTISPTW